jgi:predicted nucleic acid-binding protein
MTTTAIDAVIPAGVTVLLDTSAVLAYLSGAEPASAAAAAIIDGLVASGRNQAIVSAITVTEALVRPMRAVSPTAVRLVDDFLLHFPNLRVEPVTSAVAREAARIRAATAAPVPDALILATAVVASAAVVFGTDRSWPGVAKRAALATEIILLDRVSSVRRRRPRPNTATSSRR